MAQDTPNIVELLQTVNEFISEITDKLDGQDRYHALCAKFLLEIVERELCDWRPSVTEDDKRIAALLNRDVAPAEVVVELSRAIKRGEFDDRMDSLLEVLLAHVRSKVEITKPSYLQQFSRI